MNVLGIETSCDETAASVVRNGTKVLSHVVASSLKDHRKFGGIIPEIASRRQLELIHSVALRALRDAGINLRKIHAVAATQSPGLIGSLLVGQSYGRALSYALRRPYIPVDHVKAHLYAACLEVPGGVLRDVPGGRPSWPAVGLIVSGGHTSLYHLRDPRHVDCLGQTRDDAAGEAFDKVARILGLGYPGGPVINRLASKGFNRDIRFPCARLSDSFDFSFSGIKTAVLYHTQKHPARQGRDLAKIVYAFQDSVVSILVQKSIAACRRKDVLDLVVGGGVAANSELRSRLTMEAARHRIRVRIPPPMFCVDNAAMVAGLAYHLRQR